ncbi:hypothetical protein N1851_008285 [Merluccius polli]|uniref:Uncharacterized protein n=1 Tax=Merluccius polli TaxID=89951 RepID=A0AA47P4Q7_MERPO|nr:hypothetical protein N1851_008285 [Merluccius polli]
MCPSNLHILGKVDSPACPLWQRRGTLEHILSCCLKALGEGRYRWHHDQVHHCQRIRPAKKSLKAGHPLGRRLHRGSQREEERVYNMLGIIGASKQRVTKMVTEAAEVASRWLWIRRGESWVR